MSPTTKSYGDRMNYIAQSLVAINDRGAILRWDPVYEDDLDGYNVYMAENEPINFVRINMSPIWQTMFITPILRPDLKYYFYVTSVDMTGNESEPSAIIEFMLSDAKPNPNFRRVIPPHKEVFGYNEKKLKDVAFEDFMTRFEWADWYFIAKQDIQIPVGGTVSRPITNRSFTTFFTIGG